mmetsp:Transcript_19605/g.45623  ORF Transcript_19605/g.45623 Transcript_19605/m.45623 type:complete len:304 (+) Transcript_19605:93-1004(+)
MPPKKVKGSVVVKPSDTAKAPAASSRATSPGAKRKHASTGPRPPASPHAANHTSRLHSKAEASASQELLVETSAVEVVEAVDQVEDPVPMEEEEDVTGEPGTKKLVVAWDSEVCTQQTAVQALSNLQRQGTLCDAALVGGSGKKVPVHSIVLAAHSPVMLRRLRDGVQEFQLGSASDEALDILMQWCYGNLNAVSYKPSTPEVNAEVLQLSSELSLPQLAEVCAYHLASGITTANVVTRMQLCEAYGLPKLHAALVQALIQDKAALALVARSGEVLQQPALMRELLGASADKARREVAAALPA